MPTISLTPEGNFSLSFPSLHSITLPATAAGALALKRILQAQAREGQHFARDSAPTQWLVDKWLAANEPSHDALGAERRKAVKEVASTLTLEDLGI